MECHICVREIGKVWDVDKHFVGFLQDLLTISCFHSHVKFDCDCLFGNLHHFTVLFHIRAPQLLLTGENCSLKFCSQVVHFHQSLDFTLINWFTDRYS